MKAPVIAAALTLWVGLAWAQPVPADPIGTAVGNAIRQNLIQRGFAANDPRIIATVTQVSERLRLVSAANAPAFTWLRAIGRVAPVATVALAVGGGLLWLFSGGGDTVAEVSGANATFPAIVSGQPVYQCGPGGVKAGSAWGCISQATYGIGWNPIRKINIPGTPVLGGMGITYTNEYFLSGNWNTNSGGFGYNIALVTATQNCPSGNYYTTGGCLAVTAPANHISAVPNYVPVATALDGVSLPVLNGAADPALLAEASNRLWADAAAQPNYTGEPFIASSPVTSAQVTPGTATVGSYRNPVPLVDPIAGTNPTGSGSTEILGPDPGIEAPTLAEPPDWFTPLSGLVGGLFTWVVPSHSATCPTWGGEVSFAPGHSVTIDSTGFCSTLAQYAALVLSLSMAAWILSAAFIVLEA